MEILNSKLVNALKGLGDKKSKQSAPWKWITGLFALALSLFTVAYLTYRAYKQGKELAKLKHEKDVTAELELQEKFKLEQAETSKVFANAAQKLYELRRAEKAIDLKIEKTKKYFELERERINAAKNWNDMDDYLRTRGLIE